MQEGERHKLLVEWNDTATDYPADKTVHRLFEEQVERTPDTVAVVFEDEQMTYAELNAEANQLAHYLRKLGIGPEVLVGICVERSLEIVVGLLGILKAGGAYVPLDPAYPEERLAFMLEDAQVRVLLTQDRLRERLPEHSATVVRLDSDRETTAGESEVNLGGGAEAGNLAYAVYTSGSTGAPKGVMVEHGSLTNHCLDISERYDLGPGDRVLQFAAIGFDVLAEEIFPSWASGATVVLWPGRALASAADFSRLAEDVGLTVANLPAAYWREWVSELSRSGGRLPSDLRLVIAGSERVSPESLSAWSKLAGERVSWRNAYGTTEATVTSTVYEPTAEGEVGGVRSVPIGRPIANTRVYLLDRHMEPVAVGTPGEIYIGGVGVARGYLNRPELTAEKFIPDSYSDEPGARLYKTGDLARYLPDGNIEFLGRMDHQVKVRGYRIELGEIETVLGRHEAVDEAVVAAREDQAGNNRLVAYVVPRPHEEAPTHNGLRGYLKRKLPGHMVPSAFVTLDALPLTPNGKVDREALPKPDQTRPELEEAYVGPRSPVEERLAGIWAEVLGLERVGVHDDFFELGGHSLLATRVVSQVGVVFGVELSLRALFEEPTVAALAEGIEKAGSEARYLQAPPVTPVSREGRLPLSFAQQRMWFWDQLASDSPMYNIPTIVHLTGRLDVAALGRSLNEIVRRHEVLRTTFTMEEGGPVQVIAPAQTIALPVVDLMEVPRSERESEAQRLAPEEARRPFDLTRGPLLRASLLRLDEEDHVLLLTMHHIVSDGWSVGIFFSELATLYEAYSEGEPSPLPEPSIQYADYAIWQREWLQGEVLEEQLDYWKRQLEGAPASLTLPTDRPRRGTPGYSGAKQSVTLTNEQSEALRAFSQREGATLYMTLLAAFQTLLYRYSGQEDLMVGTPIAGRNRPEVEGTIGVFVNTLLMRGDLSGEPTFRELLARVREDALGAFAHQDLSFERLVAEIEPGRDPNRNPLFQVMFAFETVPPMPARMGGLATHPLEVDTGTAKFDLTLVIEDSEAGLRGAIEYDTGLFDAATIERMVGHFHMLLEGIAADPDLHISKLPLLTEAERHKLLVEWNDTQADYPQDKTIHQLFEEQVERTPDAVAVVFEGQQMTYRELNARANQLAHYLRKLGVGPEVLVGICVERSLEMIVGLLGILKAGGAYVPLDPTYPKERLSFMLEDTQVPVLLTQRPLLEELPALSATVVCLDWEGFAHESEENPANEATAESLAYVLYTSGSTGRPKGVCCRHAGVINLLTDCERRQRLPVGAKCSLYTNLGFDVSVYEIFSALFAGGALHIVPESVRYDSTACVEWFSSYEIQGAYIAPFMLDTVSDWMNQASGKLCLHRLLVGVEPIREQLLTSINEFLPALQIINGCGPTEASICATLYSLPPQSTGASNTLIGRPVQNTQVYLLDRNLQPVPVGVPGELHVGGDGLARGYLNRPELTAEKFIPNPFSEKPEDRLYKTGDLARYLPDGNIEFLGRIDHQVKIRGFRVELGEIEAVLGQHPAIRNAVVVAREEKSEDKRLLAYVVSNKEPAPSPSELRGYLIGKLPGYMVPSAFVALGALPLTPNGKVDRKALPEPDQARSEMSEGYVAPRTPVEEAVAGVWAELLGLERVGMNDDFFELGGHSLLATQVIYRLRDTFQVEVSLRDFFEGSTVAELSGALIANEAKPGQTERIARILKSIEGMSAQDMRTSLQQKEQRKDPGSG